MSAAVGARVLGCAACLWLLAATASERADAPAAPAATRIPFVPGLTVVRATSQPLGDYESLRTVNEVTADGYRITVSGEAPSDDGRERREVALVRRVRAVDQQQARQLRLYFHTGDPEQFSRTVPRFSEVMVNELRDPGYTRATYLHITPVLGITRVGHAMSGTLQRMPDSPRKMRVLVNGRRILLPVIHARGRLGDGVASDMFDFVVLDDPGNPILLRQHGYGFKSDVVKIDYPEPAGSENSIERQLAHARKAEVYGIHFSFASARLRPQSDAVLREIAAALREHPGWSLRIDGHTDGIGGDAANLELSQRRAAAVKAALVAQHGIAAARLSTSGHGERQPRGSNDTAEGRALNRRVELTRP